MKQTLGGGASGDDAARLSGALAGADLYAVLERLPAGMQTPLGEGGGLLSAGEGQRVRYGRGIYRAAPRLAVLDEPCRGLDRAQRRRLLEHARSIWRGATLLCVTHDVRETLGFERVIVLEGGRLVEDGRPADLARREGSMYGGLLLAEDEVREDLWQARHWRRLRLEDGKLQERPREAAAP